MRLLARLCAAVVLGASATVGAQSLDTSFNPGANGAVLAIAVQADGKILLGGEFSTLGGGGTGTTTRNRIGRLNADGSLDTSFNPGANGTVSAIAVQADGKILVGGGFPALGGGTGTTVRRNIARLNADGSVDMSFNPGANGEILALAVQADGKILVGGKFTSLGGGDAGTTTRNYLGRLNADGTLDTSFNPGANSWVYAVAVQADGKILVGGDFTTLGGGGTGTTTRNRIGRLNADGSLDTSFNPSAATGSILALAVQTDGKILVGGSFTGLVGNTGPATRNEIGRLNADGSLDDSFPPGVNSFVFAFALQTDGKILVGGAFTTLGDSGPVTRNRLGRLHASGSLDTGFNPGAGHRVLALTVQGDGKILVGGEFTTLGGGGTGTTTRNFVGRLNLDATAPTISTQPQSQTIGSGQTATISVTASGTTPLTYQWFSGTSGTTTSPISGATSSSFTTPALSSTTKYWARVSNDFGTASSSTATITVSFTDTLTAGSTLIRAVHVTELRTRVNALRTRFGLAESTWTDASLGAGASAVRAIHITELRTALGQAYTAAGQAAPTFTDATLNAGTTVVKALHVQELRDKVNSLELQ